MKKLPRNSLAKNILSAAAVAIFGFILLNLAFLFDFIFQSAIRGLVRLFIPFDPNTDMYWFPPLMHASFVVIIGLISCLVFRSKLSILCKAIYMTVPVAVALVNMGMFSYRWPIIGYSAGSLLCIGTLYYFHKTKQPWLYYYTIVLVGLVLAIFTLLGGEI